MVAKIIEVNPFALDLRALALFRMAVGCILLADLAIRFPDIATFYLPDGVCPVDAMPHSHWSMKHLELYRLLTNWWEVAGMFFLAAVFATSLTLGFYSRTSALLSWYLLASLQNRNIYLSDGGDLLLRVVLLIAIFLPLGARWSVDASRHPEWEKLPDKYFSWATVAYVTQVCVMYLTAGLLKSDAAWRVTGDALYMALSLDQFATAFAQALVQYPTLLRVLNFLALSIELCAPLLLLCPFFIGGVRTLGILLLACFHLGIASCMHLGLFVPITLAVLLALLPTDALDRVLRRHPGAALEPEEKLPSGYRLSVPARVFLGSVIFFIPFQNAMTIPGTGVVPSGTVLQSTLQYGRATGLMQNWTLFAPHPLREDGWFIVDATCEDGTRVDLLSGAGPPVYTKPELPSAQFKNQRWRRHFQSLWQRYNPTHVPLYLRWAGREWNRTHPEHSPVRSVRLVFMREITLLPGLPQQPQLTSLGEFPSRWLGGTL
jgi:hypothetical protein